MKGNFSSLKLGILGGGQLGRMFSQEALDYNLELYVLDPDSEAPCSNISKNFFQGDLGNFDHVYNFGKDLDIITIEIENVNVSALFALEKSGVKVFPQPAVIEIIQDKGLQKKFYLENGIPTSEFILINDFSEIEDHSYLLPMVQKLRKSGYDGRGVQVLNSRSDLSKALYGPSVLERKVEIKKEIAIIVSRNPSGEIKSFPAVEMDFHPEANLVEFLFSPSGISSVLEENAKRLAEKVAEKIGITGILAVELFIDQDDNILVNEIAPRPHNSGHHTIEANYTSQYNQLLRAILDLPLGSTENILPSVMVNLLGEPGFNGLAIYKGIEEVLKMQGVYLHLYGKKITRPYRKMGHVTITNPDAKRARENAISVKNILKVIA